MPRRFNKRGTGKKGHVKRDCPNKSPKCDVCSRKGHEWSNCPDICHIDCQDSFEHLARDCPDRCYVCSDSAWHAWSDCPKICQDSFEHLASDCPDRCYVCDGKGHEWSNCPDICHISCQDSFEHLARDCPGMCYVCGNNEHEWSDCPDICRNCKGDVHMTSDCPNIICLKSPRCDVCGEKGHEWNDCPDICHNCQATFEHLVRDCPDTICYKSQEDAMRICHKRGEKGHVKSECPICYKSKSQRCDLCSKKGHEWIDCPIVLCNFCQGTGHKASDCVFRGNSLQLSLPQSSSKAVVPPPSKAVVPPTSSNVVPPPSSKAVVPQSSYTSYMLVPPLTSNTGVPPTTSKTTSNVVPPPSSRAVVPPPSFKAAVPPTSNAVVPPTSYTVVPPCTSNAVVPPSSNVVPPPPSSKAAVPPTSSRAVGQPPYYLHIPPRTSNAVVPPSSNVVVTLTSSNVVPPPSRAVVPPPSKAVLPSPSSNADEIPSHWKISREYRTLEDAVTGLWNQELKFKMFRVDAEEQAEIEQLLHGTWKQDVVGIGSDARNLGHTSIQVEKVERVENPEMYERYSEKKRKLLRRLRDPKLGDTAFTPVNRLPYSSGPVLTATKMDSNSRILRRNTEPKINEYYLFHGTKQEFANIIARDGMDNRFGSQNALLGAGLYTAESCTKADQYTDAKTSRSSGLHRMFLVRVLLGKMYVNANKDPPKFKRPPCQSCQQSMCNCPHTQHYDSVMDNYHRRLFREFVVYEQCQCYPEYLITYTRVGGASHYQPPPARPAIPVAAAAAPRQRASFAPTAPPPTANPNPAEKKCAVM